MVYADWPNHIFHVPRADLTLVQSVPTEIRECNLNWLRLQILAIEDDPEAMTFPTVFRHFPEVTLGSLTFAKVMEMLEPYTITFEDGQYAVDLIGANSNFGDRVNVNQVSVRSSNSAGMTSSPAIEYLAFNDQVTFDIPHGSAGQTYPVGTVQYPVNNIVDACAIADYRRITKIKFKHHGNVLDNDYDYTGFILEGDAQATTSLHVDPLPNLTAAVVKGLTFSGTVDGGVAVLDCKVDGVNFFSGSMRECGLTDTPVVLGGSGTATLNKCISLVAGGNARPQIDFDDEPTNLAIRGWEGGLELVNKTTTEGEVSIDLNSGILYIRPSCTAGEIIVRGIGRLVDESTNGCVVNYDGLIDPAYVQYLTFADHIWIDETLTTHGIVYPIGTPSSPVGNWTDALALSAHLGIHQFMVHGPSTIPATADITGATIMGHHAMSSVVTVADGCTTGAATFKYMTLGGMLSTENGVIIEDAIIGNLSNVSGYMRRCALTDIMTLGGNRNTTLDMCFRGDKPIGTPPSIDMGGSGQSLGVRGWMGGGLTLSNLDDPDGKISVDFVTGRLDLSADLVQGSIWMRGTGELNDAGHSLTIMADELINKGTIAKGVWDENIGSHLLTGTSGLVMGINQFAGAVHIDKDNGTAGVDFPQGTAGHPVDTVEEAISIAAIRGISTLQFDSDYHFVNTTYIAGYVLQGKGMLSTTLSFDAGSILAYCQARDVRLTGDMTGISKYDYCLLEDLGSVGLAPSAIDILVQNCALSGTVSMPSNYSGNVRVLDSWAFARDQVPPTLDMGDGAGSIIVHNYSGGIQLRNVTQDNLITLLLNTGLVSLEDTVTAATIQIKGVGSVIDNSTGTTIVNTDGLMSKNTVATAVWDEPIGNHLLPETTGHSVYHTEYVDTVMLDETSLNTGTNYPVGTRHNPVNNWADALTIRAAHNFGSISVSGDSTVPAGIDVSGLKIQGNTPRTSSVTFDPTCINEETKCFDITVSGTMGTFMVFNHCRINTSTNISGEFHNCVINDDIHLAGDTDFYSCYDGIPGVGIPTIHVDTCISLGIWDWQGGIRISSMTTIDTVVSAMITAGRLLVDSSDTEGNIIVKGMANLVGTTGGTTIDSDGLITKDAMQDYIWDAALADHTDAGSTGETLGGAATVDVDPTQIAEAVWDSVTSSHATAGTFGGELAQKSDTSTIDTDEISTAIWSHDPNADGTVLDKLDQIASDASSTRKHTINKAVISGDERTVTIYDDDLTTVLFEFDVSFDKKVRTPK